MAAKVNPITRTEVLAQFKNSVANRFTVTKDTCFQTLEADTNLGLRLLVSQRLEPISNRLCAIVSLISKYFNHFVQCNL